MNLHSSRSHAILILYVEKRVREVDSQGNSTGFKCYLSRVNLVDLAGSEDVNRSNAAGARFKEAVHINSGLLQLHRVLDALCRGEAHVPYRDSALTRVLQDSLGGTSRTVLLAHVSPLDRDAGETASTLRFASAARSVGNATRANVVRRPDGGPTPPPPARATTTTPSRAGAGARSGSRRGPTAASSRGRRATPSGR